MKSREIIDAVTDELKKHGATEIKYVARGRGHPRVWFTWQGKRLYKLVSSTPGDSTAHHMARRDVRSILGIVSDDAPKKPAAPKPKKNKAPSPEPECPNITAGKDHWAPLEDLKAKKARIVEPGIYDMDAEIYHADPCEPASLSSSGARLILDTCPAVFWYQRDHPEPATRALDFGNACHAILLEGEKVFFERNEVLPEDFNGRTKVGKALVAEIEEAGRTPLRHEEWQQIQSMLKALRDHPFAMAAFENGNVEKSLFWRDRFFDVWRRARPDFLPSAGRILADFKTARSVRPDDLRREIANLGYHMQAEWVMDAVQALEIIEDPKFVFIFQEKTPPYLIVPVELEGHTLAWGRLENQRALKLFADCLQSGHWPGYAEDVMQLALPQWEERRLQERQDAGAYEFWRDAQSPIPNMENREDG